MIEGNQNFSSFGGKLLRRKILIFDLKEKLSCSFFLENLSIFHFFYSNFSVTIEFEVKGRGSYLAVRNQCQHSMTVFIASPLKSFNGALARLKSIDESTLGLIKIRQAVIFHRASWKQRSWNTKPNISLKQHTYVNVSLVQRCQILAIYLDCFVVLCTLPGLRRDRGLVSFGT